jgi:hypothetical protein
MNAGNSHAGNRMTNLLAVSAVACVMAASGAAYIGLGECGWLDRYLARSG